MKDWNEIEEGYGMILYKPVGYAKIKAKVVDDSEAIFTPCSYKIDNVEFLEGNRVINQSKRSCPFVEDSANKPETAKPLLRRVRLNGCKNRASVNIIDCL